MVECFLRVSTLFPACVSLILQSCQQHAEVVSVPQQKPAGEYSSFVQPVFDQHCNSADCHGGGPRGFAGGLDLTSYDGVMRGSTYGAVVISGSPFMSHLVQSINPSDTTLSPISSVQMPAGRNSLSHADIQTIAAWVRNGGRNDLGRKPFSGSGNSGRVFFTSQSVDLVGVLDTWTNLLTQYVSVGWQLPFNLPPQAPHNVQIDDQGRYYYVTLIAGSKLKKYDASTNQLAGEVVVGTSPAHVVITPDGSKAYVTNFDQSVGRVYVVNTATMTVSKIIASSLMKATHGARLSHDGKYLYAASNGLDLLHVINTSTDSLVQTIPVASNVPPPPIGSFVHQPYQVAVRSDDQFIYTTLRGTGRVSLIRRDGDSFSLVTDTIRVGLRPLQCEVTPDKRFLYVCNQGSGSVSVIDAQNNRTIGEIVGVGQQPHGIDISDDSRRVYVTCENVQAAEPPHHPIVGSKDPGFLVLIDVGTQSIVKRIEIGGFGAGVSVYPGKGN